MFVIFYLSNGQRVSLKVDTIERVIENDQDSSKSIVYDQDGNMYHITDTVQNFVSSFAPDAMELGKVKPNKPKIGVSYLADEGNEDEDQPCQTLEDAIIDMNEENFEKLTKYAIELRNREIDG